MMQMRGRKRFASITSSFLIELATHAAMGVAIGLGFALALVSFDGLGLKGLIARSVDPHSTTVVFVATITLAVAIGATLTGFILSMMDKSGRDG
jgi:hypothetical protein